MNTFSIDEIKIMKHNGLKEFFTNFIGVGILYIFFFVIALSINHTKFIQGIIPMTFFLFGLNYIFFLYYQKIQLYQYYIREIYKIARKIVRQKEIVQTYYGSEKTLKEIQSCHEKIQKIRKSYSIKYFYFTQRNTNELAIWLENITKILIAGIDDIRHDLIARIENDKQILSHATEEFKKIDTETSSNLKLQKTRLDRQIKQFEELQRVIVKV